MPADADIAIVTVIGYTGTNGTSDLLDKLSWDNGASVDFTKIIGEVVAPSPPEYNHHSVQASYMASTSPDWPGSGSQTLSWSANGTIAGGYNIACFFYKNVDLSDPIVDTDSRVAGGDWVSSLSGVGSNDMGIVVGFGDADSIDADPSGSGQTALWEPSLYNLLDAGIGEELGEGALDIDNGGNLVPIAFALKAPAGSGASVNTYTLDLYGGQARISIAEGGADYSLSSQDLVNDSIWHYLAGTYDGSDLKIYVDGNLQGTNTAPEGDLDINSGDLEIGSDFSSAFLDEVKIYPYARTADQIKQDYNAGLAGQSSPKGAAAAFGASSNKWMSDGLVGYWKFDESATTSGAIDSSGNGNGGAYEGNASSTVGKFGKGSSFYGDGDSINCGSGDSLDNLSEKTICSWIKPKTNVGDFSYLVGKDSGTGLTGWNLYLEGASLFWYQSFGTGAIVTDSNYDVAVGEWQYVCLATDSQTNLANTSFWVNGVKYGELTDVTSQSGAMTNDSSYNLLIGSADNGTVGYEGEMDELRIYNRILSPRELKKLYEWAPGPVAYWKFDEKSGTTAYDSVATSSTAGGNDGSISGASWTRGKYGGGLEFDGSNSVVDTGSKSAIDDLGPLSVSAWIYPRSLGESSLGTVIAKSESGGAGNGSWYINLRTNNQFAFAKEFASDGMLVYSSNNAISFNEWQYITINWNGGNDASADVEMYVNGILLSHSYDQDGGTAQSDSAKTLYIGNDTYSSRTFDGLIDDVRIYNYARTQKQILQDMAGASAGASASQGALKHPVLHLSFDEGRGGTAYDSSYLWK